MRKKIEKHIILNTALKVFAEFGYKKTTLDDIAQKLNMTKGNLYLYAENKKDLYEKTVAQALLRWQQHVLEAVKREADVRKQFLTMCHQAVVYLSLDEDLRAVLIRDPDIFPLFPVADPFEDINNNSVTIIKDIIRRGISENKFRSVNIDQVGQVIFLLYKMFIIRMYLVGEDESILNLYEATLSLVTQGLFLETDQTTNQFKEIGG
ncbi:TetR/AcrR family transcriptional regulator [candidate division CSSED10-310 bacterium]|uniref:TetR/AcrR family transcriptional regulator n=1 Tax=candidate division CSSED10-310 bacterium TaxID=2855610 RepID=A0ABV6YVD4_UNCC1